MGRKSSKTSKHGSGHLNIVGNVGGDAIMVENVEADAVLAVGRNAKAQVFQGQLADWQAAGVWDTLHLVLLERLAPAPRSFASSADVRASTRKSCMLARGTTTSKIVTSCANAIFNPDLQARDRGEEKIG